MKEFNLLVWLTQLGLGVALPLAGFVYLGIWLHRSCGWGVWTVPAGMALGLAMAAGSLRSNMQAMARMAKGPDETGKKPISFNDHD